MIVRFVIVILLCAFKFSVEAENQTVQAMNISFLSEHSSSLDSSNLLVGSHSSDDVSIIEKLEESTGCDGSGYGATTIGCTLHSTTSVYEEPVDVRAGFSLKGDVGVGIVIKW